MATVTKIRAEDGTYTILSDGRTLRCSLDSREADDVIRSLHSMLSDEEEAGSTLVPA